MLSKCCIYIVGLYIIMVRFIIINLVDVIIIHGHSS